jgi:antirestriction protein ArdC
LAATLRSLEEGVDAIVGSEDFGRYLTVISHFHQYSFGNVTLIHMQRPEATRVAGFRKWQELGRQVRRGEQGIKILVPHRVKVQSEDESDEHFVIRSFGVGTVFDITQSDGAPLPEPPVVREIRESSDAGAALFSHLARYLDAEGIPLVREDTLPANGYWEPSSRRITLGLHLEGDQATKTLAHETAHFVADHQLGMPKEDVETIAESSAFVVLQHYGIDSSGYSFGYVARWAKDRTVLKRNLDAIQRTAHRVIEGIEGCAIADKDTETSSETTV